MGTERPKLRRQDAVGGVYECTLARRTVGIGFQRRATGARDGEGNADAAEC